MSSGWGRIKNYKKKKIKNYNLYDVHISKDRIKSITRNYFKKKTFLTKHIYSDDFKKNEKMFLNLVQSFLKSFFSFILFFFVNFNNEKKNQ